MSIRTMIESLDLTRVDSGQVDLDAPQWFATELLDSMTGQIGFAEAELPPNEEIGLRLISNAVLTCKMISPSHVPEWAESFDLSSAISSDLIIMPESDGPGSMSWLRLGNWISILMPPVTDKREIGSVVQMLNDLEERYHNMNFWIIDMAPVTAVSSGLAAHLIGFQQTLAAQDKELALLWVKRESISETLFPAMQKHFHLANKGAFYLSKR
jgi:hypothetical protein